MKEERDFNIVYHINQHYLELIDSFKNVNSLDAFKDGGTLRKAILFDLFQIGELLNQLSKAFVDDFGHDELSQIVGLRNRIVHGYATIIDTIIYDSICNNLTPFINRLNSFSKKKYKEQIETLVNKTVRVNIHNSETFGFNGCNYLLNNGVSVSFATLDGTFQNIFVISDTKQAKVLNGQVIYSHYDDKNNKGTIFAIVPGLSIDINELKKYIEENLI